MASIATLTIDLVGKSSKLTAELKKANKNTKSWADKTRQMTSIASKTMLGFAATGVAALTTIYVKTAQVMDQQAKMADRLGITTEKLIGLQHAANLSGASNEELNKSLQRMQQGLGQVAQTGTGEAKYALDGLGLSIKDLKGLAPEEQFKLIADRLKGVTDQSQKVYIAQSLMGKSGVKMINLMEQGADGIQSMIDEADALGLAFNRIDAAKIEMANDSFDKAQKTSRSFGQALATETAPIVAALSEMWTDNAKEAGGFGVLAQEVVTKVGKGLGFLADLGRGLQISFVLIRQAVLELGNAAIQSFNAIYQAGGSILEYVGMDVESAATMEKFAQGFSETTSQMGAELAELLSQPMPSSKIETWIADVQEKFEAKAKEQADKGKTDLSSLLIKPSENNEEIDKQSQNLIDKARNQYQQIFDAQLEMEGKEIELENRRYERKKTELEREYELLREKNLITAEIEAEHTTAKEQLTSQHNQRLADIENERNQKTMQGYSELLGVMGSYFDGMEGKQAGYARVAISLGQTLLDEEKRKSVTSIWSNTYDTAMKAYNALASLPVIGPALGGIAAGGVITLGGVYAAKVAGLTSFDGGGYTGDGSRTAGMDGKGGFLAMLHPQETVIDHTKGQSLGSQTNSITSNHNYYGVSAKEQRKIRDNNRQQDFYDAQRVGRFINRPA